MPHTGSCLCGQTKIELNTTHTDQYTCYCTDCRQTSGSALSTNILAPQEDIKITGPVKEYKAKAASGNIVTRIFCENCGSAISHKSPMFKELQALQTGNFADFAKIPITMEVFVKDRWSVLQPVPNAEQVEAMPAFLTQG